MQHCRIIACSVVAACYAAAGCGTIDNVVGVGTPPACGEIPLPPNEIYGGVRSSVNEGVVNLLLFPTPSWNPVRGVYLLIIDSPLCAVADTLTLPITIAAAWERRRQSLGGTEATPPKNVVSSHR